MNIIMKAITRMRNLQRDKHLRQDQQQRRPVHKESGFDQVLNQEQAKLKRKEERHDIMSAR